MKVVIHHDYEAMKPIIARIPSEFDEMGIVVYQARNTLREISCGDDRWVVKRFKSLKLFHRIVYTLTKSKAKRSFEFARRFRENGIDTPHEVAYIEVRCCGLVKDCFFISEKSSALTLFPELVETEYYDRNLADCLADFFVEMHRKGILHGDPNMKNILYRRESDGVKFSVIDTNRSRFKSSLSRKECIENLKRLTHRRDLLSQIVARYATLRGWDVQATVADVMKLLHRFERSRTIRHSIKRKLGMRIT